MKTKSILIITAAAFLLSNCATQKKCARKFPPQTVTIIKDSIREVVTFRDTTIYIKLDPVTVSKTDTVYVKNGVTVFREVNAESNYATAKAWIGQNRLNLTLTDKDTTITVKLNNALKTARYWEMKYSTEQKTIEVKYIPKIIKILSWLGVAGLILALIWVLKKFKIF